MKVALTIPQFGPEAGGVGSVVLNLANELTKAADMRINVLDLNGGFKYSTEISLKSCFAIKPGFSIELSKFLCRGNFDVIHHHGVWHPISISLLFSCILGGPPIICSPHGMLEPWIVNRGKIKKSLASIYEKPFRKKVKCFHALTYTEVQNIRSLIPEAKIFYIPNGVSLATYSFVKARKKDSKIILYFGRFHSKKGVKILLKAWSKLDLAVLDYKLKIVGWGDTEEVNEIGNLKNVEILPPIFNAEDKHELLSNADFLILPSFSEGLPMAVLEAWSKGTPTIITPQCNLNIGFEEGASIKIEPNEISILQGLKEAISMSPDEWKKMSRAAYKVCEYNYSMPSVIEKTIRMYKWASDIPCNVSDIIIN